MSLKKEQLREVVRDFLMKDHNLLVLAGVIGPFLALLGVYRLRRAQAEGLALGRARALMVTGTCGIALSGVAVWWTVLGSLITLAILGYWSRKIAEWRAEPPSR